MTWQNSRPKSTYRFRDRRKIRSLEHLLPKVTFRTKYPKDSPAYLMRGCNSGSKFYQNNKLLKILLFAEYSMIYHNSISIISKLYNLYYQLTTIVFNVTHCTLIKRTKWICRILLTLIVFTIGNNRKIHVSLHSSSSWLIQVRWKILVKIFTSLHERKCICRESQRWRLTGTWTEVSFAKKLVCMLWCLRCLV